ncbi:hypothetical protein A0H81_12281 [Grifola frondosa]|uniref:Uncharacterized protein n=1 Tax=Grifola frondosa TaxID=5627 RepID=A0A1C7LUU1_GRIFR|nr:hypothetical protein A0H81_12281 [Grifola frondosa]
MLGVRGGRERTAMTKHPDSCSFQSCSPVFQLCYNTYGQTAQKAVKTEGDGPHHHHPAHNLHSNFRHCMMSTPDLLTNCIYACLYAHQDGGHDWALLSTGRTSTKSSVLYRATNEGSSSWRFECKDERVTRSCNVRLLVHLRYAPILFHFSLLLTWTTRAGSTQDGAVSWLRLYALLWCIPLDTPARDGQERFTPEHESRSPESGGAKACMCISLVLIAMQRLRSDLSTLRLAGTKSALASVAFALPTT